MSFTVKLTRFSKKYNSTMQPTGSQDWGEFDCILKNGCSALNPDIALQFAANFSPVGYNYAYIADFNRYYFIEDWYWENRLWHARMKVDALASWKTAISAYNAYVVRSAAAYDGDVVDMLYPAQANVTMAEGSSTGFENFVGSIENGYFVLGIIGKGNGQNGGAVTYYKASPSQMTALTNYMLDTANFGQISDISEDLLKCIFNPLQYIVSCMWFPTNPITVNGPLNIGWWNVSGSLGTGINPLATLTWGLASGASFEIPKHPQAATRGNYLNMPPFSTYHLYAGPWGVIPLDNSNLLGRSNLSCDWKVDYVTGSGRLRLTNGLDRVISEHFAQVGVPIMLGQNVINQGALANVVNAPANAISSAMAGDIGGVISNTYTGVVSAAQLSQSEVSTTGSNGSFTFSNTFKLVAKFFSPVGEDLASRGRPLCQARTLSSLSGYVMCADADPAIDCTDAEMETIVNFLNTGFYME